MHSSASPSRNNPPASTNANAAALAAALKGAAHAFSNQKTTATIDNNTSASSSRSPNRDGQPSSISRNRTGAGADNGALLAATQAVARDQYSATQSQPRSPTQKTDQQQESVDQ